MIFQQYVHCMHHQQRSKDSIEQVPNTDHPISISHAQFEWDAMPDTTDVFKMQEMNVELPKGALCFVVGKVGSGKSSLLQALIGEMNKTAGTVQMSGSVAYCTQIPWIQNSTIRENITVYDYVSLIFASLAQSLTRTVTTKLLTFVRFNQTWMCFPQLI